MTTNSPSWYVPAEGKKPAGPFTAEQIIESWRAGRLDKNTLCWREGMAKWLPLAQVEPFAAMIRPAAEKPRRGGMLRRLAASLVALVFLVAAAGIFYIYWNEWSTIHKANGLIAAEDYEEALAILRPFLDETYFYRGEASYLCALAAARQFASAANADEPAEDALAKPKRRFHDLFQANEQWRERAKADLADMVAQVPADAEDALARSLAVAQTLNGLKVVESARLADALVKKAQERTKFQSPALVATDADYVMQVLEWNPSLAENVVDLALSKEGQPEQGLVVIRGWARKASLLAGSLSSAVLQVADRHVATRRYRQAKTFVDAARQIDSPCDTWSFWENQFQKTRATDPIGVVEILACMIQDEQDPVRLDKAAELYIDLRRRHTEVPPPPPEIGRIIDRVLFHERIADAERPIEKGHYRDALTKLDKARNEFTDLWKNDENAHKIYDDVRFHVFLDKARDALKSGALDLAESNVRAALGIRGEDKEARNLLDQIVQARVEVLVGSAKLAYRNGELNEVGRLLRKATELRPDDPAVHTMLDKVEVEKHRRGAEKAVATIDFPGAVEEILNARTILEKPSNVSWSGADRVAVDQLAKTLIGDLHDQAEKSSKKRGYQEAKEKVELGLRLSPKDERLSELKKKIEELEADPKTANLSGKWVGPNGECELIDNGTDAIGYKAVKLPEGVRECTGGWTRKGDKLDGKFRVVPEKFPQLDNEGTVGATVKDAKTLAVCWQRIYWVDKPRKGTWTWRGKGEVSWTKEIGSTDGSALRDGRTGLKWDKDRPRHPTRPRLSYAPDDRGPAGSPNSPRPLDPQERGDE
jgi:hypothetical protein